MRLASRVGRRRSGRPKRKRNGNLDFPVSPYVGDEVNAQIIILGANAGFDPRITPAEFSDNASIQRYISRVRNPSGGNWSWVSSYDDGVNYGRLLAKGQAVLVNACPYRSRKISEESNNRRLLERLPSTAFSRSWFLDAVLPLAQSGERLVVAKRPGLWKLPASLRNVEGIVFDPAPVSPQITSGPWAAIVARLGLGD